jgi:hypothetical protein
MRTTRTLAVLGLLCAPACSHPTAAVPVAPATPGQQATPTIKKPDCTGLDLKPATGGIVRPEGEDSGPDTVQKAQDGKSCQIADDNLAAAGRAILAEADRRKSLPALKLGRWDGKSRLQYEDLVTGRYPLLPSERAQLQKNGFIVAERLTYSTYGWAFHELYQSQLPIYVSVDAILHAIYASNDKLLATVESERLLPLLQGVLRALHCALADQAASWPVEQARDADLYLTVARSLIDAAPVPSILGSDSEVGALLAAITKHEGIVEIDLFGRRRAIDFGAYQPRGHYDGKLAPYFLAAMWLSRLELNLVSRGCRSSQPGLVKDPSETPREGALALGLVELAERAGAQEAIGQLDRAWSLFAGKREDVSFAALSALRKRAGIAGPPSLNDAAKLRSAIAGDFARSARLHPMPPGVKDAELPVIATLLGPRVVPDTSAIHLLVNDAIPNRHLLHAGDIAFVLGQDRGRAYLRDDLAAFPSLDPALQAARTRLLANLGGPDLYSVWLSALTKLAQPSSGVLPSFMGGEAFADLRINSALAGFAQLRHNNVLLAAQEMGAAGCEIPDGYVDPVPAVYDALLEYSRRGEAVMATLDPGDALGTRAYFDRLSRTLRVLAAIVQDEIAGRALSPEQRRFLSMVAEFHPPSTGGPATYSGWYFDLFRSRREDGLADASLIADYYVSAETQQAAHVGVSSPQLGFFAVDTGGPPRLFVGPLARAFESVGTAATRYRDADVERAPKVEPWSKSYRVSGLAEPPLVVEQRGDDFALYSSRALGPVTLTALDHHRRPLRSVTLPVATKPVLFRFGPQGKRPIEAVKVRVGAFTHVAVAHENAIEMSPIDFTLGGMRGNEQ